MSRLKNLKYPTKLALGSCFAEVLKWGRPLSMAALCTLRTFYWVLGFFLSIDLTHRCAVNTLNKTHIVSFCRWDDLVPAVSVNNTEMDSERCGNQRERKVHTPTHTMAGEPGGSGCLGNMETWRTKSRMRFHIHVSVWFVVSENTFPHAKSNSGAFPFAKINTSNITLVAFFPQLANPHIKSAAHPLLIWCQVNSRQAAWYRIC